MNGATPSQFVQARATGVGASSTISALPGPVLVSALRVNRAYTLTAGSQLFAGGNAGTITISSDSGSMAATAWAAIPFSWRGWNFAPCSSLMVPRGRAGLLYPGGISGGTDRGENARATIMVRQWGMPAQIWGELEVALGLEHASIGVPARFAGRSEIAILFARDTSGAAVDVSTTLQIVLIDDPTDRDPSPSLQPPPMG
jgi:hypothetical protein